ncbi:MAG: M3 family metallopeptidase, partial [Cyclobacteriaceae bacterium]
MNNKPLHFILLIILLLGCDRTQETSIQNPFVTALNQPIDYANVAADDITAYATLTFGNTARRVEEIKNTSNPTFENIFIPFDEINNDMAKARNNCFMLYWVSPDSLSRIKGIAGFQKLDSLNANIYADKDIYQKIVAVSESEDYAQLKGHRKKLVDDMITQFKQSGVNLESEKLAQFKNLQKEVNQLTSEYSTNMNTANLTLVIDEKDADGLPENFKSTYAFGETQYEIPVMPATNGPVMSNANVENTRKAYMMKYNNRASDKNLEILDQLVQKRYEIAQLMGHDSYASYVLTTRMASNPETV